MSSRAAQIDSLKANIPTTRELDRGISYAVPVQPPGGRREGAFELRIFLPAEFPQSRPHLTTFPRVAHRLVDASGAVRDAASPKLAGWTAAEKLGPLVVDVVKKFMSEPPGASPPPSSSSSSLSSSASSSLSSSGNPFAAGGPPSPRDPNSTALPPVPDRFPELERMKPSELAELLNDDAAFARFLGRVDGVVTMRQLLADLKGSSSAAAAASSAELADARAAYNERRREADELQARQDRVMDRYNVDSLVEQLAKLAAETEKETDTIAQQFLAGSIDDKAFQREFLAARELYHLRSAKRESLLMKAKRT